MERKLLVYVVMTLLAISMFQTAFIVFSSLNVVSDTQVNAKAIFATGNINICANFPPEFSYDCPTDLNQSLLYTCDLDAFDFTNESLNYSVTNLSGNLMGSIDNDGVFSVITYENMTGLSRLRFQVFDTSICSNNFKTVDVWFNVSNRNDPPIYDVIIPSLSWDQGNSYRGLFLDDHFSDPDGDDLTYKFFSFSSDFTISILNSSEIILSHTTCGEGNVIFQAIDPFNLSADSGVISLEANCPDEDSPSGGGGGGSTRDCETEWSCGEWSRCFINNSQRKECTDINGCTTPYERDFYQECTYIAHCYNGIKDIDEEDIDCGGRDCDICETCYDDKLNNDEVELDCGGPNCNACSNCADGIQNYQETGLDCGGPSCEPCPTCNDGIQNQNETGIDCGGPFCASCSRIEIPVLIEEDSNNSQVSIIILSSFLGLSILAVTYRLFKSKIHALIAAMLLALALKKRKQILLTLDQKDFLLARIISIEKKALLDKNKILVFQDLLSRLQRQLFSFLVGSTTELSLVHKQIDKLKTTKVVKSLLKKQYDLLLKLEKEKNLSRIDLGFMFESFRALVFHISKITKEEIARDVEELILYTSPQSNVIKQHLYNAMVASQFGKEGIARKKYLLALKLYQNLTDKSKEDVYSYLILTFEHLSYTSSFR